MARINHVLSWGNAGFIGSIVLLSFSMHAMGVELALSKASAPAGAAAKTITAPLTCPPQTVSGQAPYDPDDSGWCGLASDGDSSVYRLDNFNTGGYAVDAVHWWGTGACGDGSKSFTILFYEDNGGSPGTLYAQYVVTPEAAAVDPPWGGWAQGYYFEAELSPPCALSSGWICIYANADPCFFSVLCSPDGDGKGYYGVSLSSGFSLTDKDFAFCLVSSSAEGEGEGVLEGEGEIEGEGEGENFLMTCLFFPTFGQEPYDPDADWESHLSQEESTVVYDNFDVGSDKIVGIRWWGLGDCTGDTEPFVIRFYEDAGGVPGSLLSEQIGAAGRVEQTGEMFDTQEAYVYTITNLNEPLCSSSGWVSISKPSAGCPFVWLGAESGMDRYSLAGLTSPLGALSYDMAFCLILESSGCVGEDPRLKCPENSAFAQTPYIPGDGGWCAAPSDADNDSYKFENYSGLNAAIESVHWWGTEDCDTGDKHFIVAFYEDNGGSPGALYTQYDVVPLVEPVDGLYGGTTSGDRYGAALDPPCTLNAGWLCVYAVSDPCDFMWLCSPEGDAVSYVGYGANPTANLLPSTTDFAFCLVPENLLMTCYLQSEFGQTPFKPGSAWQAQDSEEDVSVVYDHFSVGLARITGIRWWSLGDCTSGADPFVIRFYEDAGGVPGELVSEQTVSSTGAEATGEIFEARGEAYVHTIQALETPLCLPEGWVSIAAPAGGCQFSWLGAQSDADGSSLFGLTKPLNQTAFDMAFCIITEDDIACDEPNLYCPEETLFAQAPCSPEAGGWCGLDSDDDLELQCYENYSGLAGSIDEVRWWGTGTCDTGGKTFAVEFYSEDQGQPSGVWCRYWIEPEVKPVYGLYGGTETAAMYSAHLSPPCPFQSGWISIYAAPDPCDFRWLCSPSGDGVSFQGSGLNPLSALTSTSMNLAFCLSATGEDPVACPENALYSQPIALPGDNYFGSMESDFARPSMNADNFSGLSRPIRGISWWGTGNSGKMPCELMVESFWVKFYHDDAGHPGSLYQQYVVTPEKREAFRWGISIAPTFYRFDAVLNMPCDLTSGWIAIQALGACCCYYSWAGSSTGDGLSYHYQNYQETMETMDFAFCLTPEEIPPEGEGDGIAEGEGGIEEGEGMLEGEGGIEGEGQVNVPDCPPESVYGQPPIALATQTILSGTGTSSIAYDNFQGISSAFTGIRWWGISAGMLGGTCIPQENPYKITFYENGDGTPGNSLVQENVEVTMVETGRTAGPETEFEFTAMLSSPVTMSEGWISIESDNQSACFFGWEQTEGGDGLCVRKDTYLEMFAPLEFDLAFCLVFQENEGEGQEPGLHSADQNSDGQISLTELLRVIQFFNSGGFHCVTAPVTSEDGYLPGTGADLSCAAHASDYNPQNWQIGLTELLRLIQFFNSAGYHPCPGMNTEDGFCPGTV